MYAIMYPYRDVDLGQDLDPADALKKLVDDPLYWREQEPEFRAYVDQGFKAVYGGEAAEQDATGRTMTPEARVARLPPFRPSVQPGDMTLYGGVGENQPNRWRDVYAVQKGLANSGHYDLDLTRETSGELSPSLRQAIRNFQRDKREEIDGILLPGGPTITRLDESLFAEGRVADQLRQGAPPQSEPDGSANGKNESLQLVSHWPKPPPPGSGNGAEGTVGLPPWMKQWTDKIRKIPRPPRGSGPKQPPEEEQASSERRAVVATMPNGDAYILLNPDPRAGREGISAFVLEWGLHKANHYDYREAQRRHGYALPMYPEEAEAVRQRAADGEQNVDRLWMAEKPMYPARPEKRSEDYRKRVAIRYYSPDGSFTDELARHWRTQEPLYAPGDQVVVIAAPDALKLGLQDWMVFKPPRGNYPEVFERENLRRFSPIPSGAKGAVEMTIRRPLVIARPRSIKNGGANNPALWQ